MASAVLNHQLSSRNGVAAAVDCGRQPLVMVSKLAKSVSNGDALPKVPKNEDFPKKFLVGSQHCAACSDANDDSNYCVSRTRYEQMESSTPHHKLPGRIAAARCIPKRLRTRRQTFAGALPRGHERHD